MIIENVILDIIDGNHLHKDEAIIIKKSIIKTIDFNFIDFDCEIIIENCIIENFLINTCWFKEGLKFINNQTFSYIDYQMGGHNNSPIEFSGCIFHSFFNFFDCQFNSTIILKSNFFIEGTNLLGNKNEGFENIFENKFIIENNIGDLKLDGIGK